MTTSSILGILFIIELALVASGLAVYLFFQLKSVKLRLKQRKAKDDEDEDSTLSLHNLFELQISRTRKKIAERLHNESEDEVEKQSTLLNQRIEFLKLEKEVLDEHVTDNTYWKKLCDGISSVLSPKSGKEPEAEEAEAPDDAKYKQRIANYQTQIANLHEEFANYRKYSKKLTSGLSNLNQEEDRDSALNELMADFKEHDERLHARLNQLELEKDKLQSSLSSAERDLYANEYKKNTGKRDGSIESTSKTSSEEEIDRLREIITRQYSSIDDLKSAVLDAQGGGGDSDLIGDKIQAVEASQNELQTCVEVLEMENQRLSEQLEAAQSRAGTVEQKEVPPQELFELRLQSKELNDKVSSLSSEIAEKDNKIKDMETEYETLQNEFMQMYAKQEGNS